MIKFTDLHMLLIHNDLDQVFADYYKAVHMLEPNLHGYSETDLPLVEELLENVKSFCEENGVEYDGI